MGTVQAETQSYVDAVKLLLAAGGHVNEKRLGAIPRGGTAPPCVSSAMPCPRIDIVAYHDPPILQVSGNCAALNLQETRHAYF